MKRATDACVLASNNASPAQRGPRRGAQPLHATPLAAVLFPAPRSSYFFFHFEAFGGFGKEVRSTLREAANQLSNKLSHAQHLDEVTWTTKNWHGLQMQRLSVVLHTAVAWQTVNELACGESGIVHGAECIAVLNGVA